MIPLHKVFEFFRLNHDPLLAMDSLYGPDAFVGTDYKITWGDFACCALLFRLNMYKLPDNSIRKFCKIAFPEVRKNIDNLTKGEVQPLIALLIDYQFLLIGENDLYDVRTGKPMDKAAFEHDESLFETSLCFMISAIAIRQAARFLKEEPDYARGCPFIKQPDDQVGTG